MMPYSSEYDAIPICRTHGACVNTPNFDKRQFCRLSLALWLENLGVRTGSVRATNRYGVIYNGI